MMAIGRLHDGAIKLQLPEYFTSSECLLLKPHLEFKI